MTEIMKSSKTLETAITYLKSAIPIYKSLTTKVGGGVGDGAMDQDSTIFANKKSEFTQENIIYLKNNLLMSH